MKRLPGFVVPAISETESRLDCLFIFIFTKILRTIYIEEEEEDEEVM